MGAEQSSPTEIYTVLKKGTLLFRGHRRGRQHGSETDFTWFAFRSKLASREYVVSCLMRLKPPDLALWKPRKPRAKPRKGWYRNGSSDCQETVYRVDEDIRVAQVTPANVHMWLIATKNQAKVAVRESDGVYRRRSGGQDDQRFVNLVRQDMQVDAVAFLHFEAADFEPKGGKSSYALWPDEIALYNTRSLPLTVLSTKTFTQYDYTEAALRYSHNISVLIPTWSNEEYEEHTGDDGYYDWDVWLEYAKRSNADPKVVALIEAESRRKPNVEEIYKRGVTVFSS